MSPTYEPTITPTVVPTGTPTLTPTEVRTKLTLFLLLNYCGPGGWHKIVLCLVLIVSTVLLMGHSNAVTPNSGLLV